MSQIEKTIFLLHYDVSKTLSENKESFVNEQVSDTKFGLERFGFNPKKPETLDVAAQKQREFNKSITKLLPNLDHHEVLMWTSFAANFFGPWGFAASIGLDFLNAYLYHREGNDFEAGLQIMLSAIPGAELYGIPIIKKYGRKYFVELLKKATWSGKMTEEEIKALQELLSKNTSKQLRKLTMKFVFKYALKSTFKNISFPNMVRLMWLLVKKYPKASFATRLVLTYKGINYTWEKLAKFLGIVDKKPVDKKLVDGLETKYKERETQIKEVSIEDIEEFYDNSDQKVADSLFHDIFIINKR